MTRTTDGRFIEKRVKIPLELQKRLIETCKKNNNYTWSQFSKELGISEHTLKNQWRTGKNTLPLSKFNQICRLIPNNKHVYKTEIIKPFWGQKVKKKGSNYCKRIRKPNITSQEFAEFYGILLGDGCIYSNLNGVSIVVNSILDKKYIEKYVPELIFYLFKVKPKLYYSKKEKKINCVVYSRELSRFLISLGFPVGKKSNSNLKIPFKNKRCISACLRGLFDTDGSIYPHPNSKVIVEISIKIPSLLESACSAFNLLDLPFKYCRDRIYFVGSKRVELFFNSIGSNNQKHIEKYSYFKNKGYVPKSKEIESFFKTPKI